MLDALPVLTDVRDFVEAGGPIVVILVGVALVLWTMILERILYFRRGLPADLARVKGVWDARQEHTSWYARKIKQKLISEVRHHLRGSLPMIKVLVALCPMLGLLGTVTGMLQVFAVISSIGTGNARAMASGVSAATLPTMVGMVVALSGFYFVSRFQQIVDRETHKLNDHMITH